MTVPIISEAQIIQEMSRCDDAVEIIDSQREALSERRDAVIRKKELLAALLDLQGVEDATAMRFPNMPQPEPARLGVRKRGKPDVQIIEEILLEHGPLHVSDIVRLGRDRGIPFIGKRTPEKVARGKLNASQRFELIGNNVWGLPHQVQNYLSQFAELRPNTQRQRNGHANLFTST